MALPLYIRTGSLPLGISFGFTLEFSSIMYRYLEPHLGVLYFCSFFFNQQSTIKNTYKHYDTYTTYNTIFRIQQTKVLTLFTM